jgi:hypothetical protein
MEVIGSIYTEVSENFQKGIIGGGISRCVKAEKHDLGVVLMNEFKVIGSLESTNQIYDVGGCSPTLSTMQGGGQEPKILVNSFDKPKCINSKGGRNGIDNLQPSIQDRCYSENGISFTITSSFLPSVLTESQILTPKRTEYGKQIRKAYESGQVQESRHNMTELEPRQDNICNTLTTVQKDNLLLENNIQKVGQISSDGSQCGTVISDNGISANLVAGTHGYANSHIATQYLIRKLTPRECGRLMGVSDEDISKMAAVNSNTQLYKQFGNSIVVDVMCAMFKNLNIKQGE